MRLPIPERLKLSVPARKIVLLPNTHFFCRPVPVASGSSPADVAVQVELALEGMAPFPVAQMYHGFFHRPEWKHALVYAAYRKRFTAEQVEAWAEAELVVPSFATLLNAPVRPSTTVLLWTAKDVTALRWEESGDAPVGVAAREVPLEMEAKDRGGLRDALLRDTGASENVVELEGLAHEANPGDDGIGFRCDSVESVFSREELDALDVRDKEEMATRRRARGRDQVLWRCLLGSVAVILLCAVLELALIGGRVWQQQRAARVSAQAATVSKILLTQNLAQRIEELSTRRLRPFEMISMISAKLPNSIVFTSATVANLNTLDLEAQAGVSEEVNTYHAALSSMPGIEKVETKFSRVQNGLTKFEFLITFKPSIFEEATQP